MTQIQKLKNKEIFDLNSFTRFHCQSEFSHQLKYHLFSNTSNTTGKKNNYRAPIVTNTA